MSKKSRGGKTGRWRQFGKVGEREGVEESEREASNRGRTGERWLARKQCVSYSLSNWLVLEF